MVNRPPLGCVFEGVCTCVCTVRDFQKNLYCTGNPDALEAHKAGVKLAFLAAINLPEPETHNPNARSASGHHRAQYHCTVHMMSMSTLLYASTTPPKKDPLPS